MFKCRVGVQEFWGVEVEESSFELGWYVCKSGVLSKCPKSEKSLKLGYVQPLLQV